MRRLRALPARTREPRLSRDAGRYLCNYAYWRALEQVRGARPLVQFVHIPPVGARPRPRRRSKRATDACPISEIRRGAAHRAYRRKPPLTVNAGTSPVPNGNGLVAHHVIGVASRLTGICDEPRPPPPVCRPRRRRHGRHRSACAGARRRGTACDRRHSARAAAKRARRSIEEPTARHRPGRGRRPVLHLPAGFYRAGALNLPTHAAIAGVAGVTPHRHGRRRPRCCRPPAATTSRSAASSSTAPDIPLPGAARAYPSGARPLRAHRRLRNRRRRPQRHRA